MLRIAYSPIYKYKLPENHRFPMTKYELIPEQLLYEGIVSENHFFHPDKMSDEDILLTHSKEFLDKLNTLNLSKKEIRNIGFPVRKGLINRGKHIVNGTLQCAYYAMDYGVAMNVAGGTHHSFRDRGEGFCIFNDFAIVSNLLLRDTHISQILIIDLDVHQGNGTAHIFRNNNAVFTFSMHGERNYPTRKEQSNFDVGLPDGTEDLIYLSTLEKALATLDQRVQPDFVFYLSGVDVLKSDKLGRLSMSLNGCRRRDEMVFNFCKERNLPVAVSMGGGYSPLIKDIINAHCNTFKAALDIIIDQ